VKNLLAEAEAAFRDGKFEEAEAMLRDVVASEPENPAACHMLGLIALGRGRHADALAEFSRAIAANPRFARAHVSLALAQVAIGDRTAAEASYRQAIALNPKLPMAVVNLAGLLMQEGRLPRRSSSSGPRSSRCPTVLSCATIWASPSCARARRPRR
jgi:Flp pilus assembly protein TadD